MSKASPLLYRMVASGQHITTAIFTVRSSNKQTAGFEYLQYKLSEVLVSSHSTGGDVVVLGRGPDTRGVENFSLNFARIDIEYRTLNADGSPGAIVKSCFDVAANVVC